ncbi:MAG: pyridoxamine 5'-phosphate oxidase family protein [Methanomicrobiales archaeon]
MKTRGPHAKKDQELTNRAEMESILHNATVCRRGYAGDGRPSIVPLSFGYKEGVIYIHSAHEGKKIAILKENLDCCIEFDECREVVREENPCKWGMRYRSVICSGKAYIVTLPEEKQAGRSCIMNHYGSGPHNFSEK